MALPVFLPESIKYTQESPVYLAKMSNMLSIQPRQYDSESPGLMPDERQKSQLKECYFMDYIRWKYGPDRDVLSNAKIVRFEDGSQFLYIGKDCFQVIISRNTHNQIYLRCIDTYLYQADVNKKMMFKPIGIDNSKRPKLRRDIQMEEESQPQRIGMTRTEEIEGEDGEPDPRKAAQS